MQNLDGVIVADIPNICDSWVPFYSYLFRACPTNLDVQNEILDNLSSFVPIFQVPLCIMRLGLPHHRGTSPGGTRGYG